MSSPFQPSILNTGIYTWVIGSAPDGNFVPLNVLGIGYQEVGYGEGGYGEGGYDTPSQQAPATSTPIWNIGSAR